MAEPHDYPRRGQQLRAESEQTSDEHGKLEIDQHAGDQAAEPSDRPPADCVRIGPGQSGGIVTVASGNRIPFSRDVAEATWHRYQGLHQAEYQLQPTNGLTLPALTPHRMASAYVLPNADASRRVGWIARNRFRLRLSSQQQSAATARCILN